MKTYTFQHGNRVFSFDGHKTTLIETLPLEQTDKEWHLIGEHWHYGLRDLKLDTATRPELGAKEK